MARRGRIVKGRPLSLPTGLEAEYALTLRKMAKQMHATVARELVAFFNARPEFQQGQDASTKSLARALVARLARRFQKLFDDHAEQIAAHVADKAAKASDTRWRSSLKELAGGVQLKTSAVTPGVKDAVAASIAENAKLIKSIPREYLAKVGAKVMESVETGEGLKTLVPYLQQQGGVTERRATNIAQDQTRKAYNNINAERMKGAGIKKFEWMHSSGGVHPRELHITPWPAGLNGGVFSFTDLPVIDERTGERGLPGQAINCRCRMRPILELDDTDKKK